MKVYELLASPSAWCKNHYALDKDGSPVEVNDPTARKFCWTGAMEKCHGMEATDKIAIRFFKDTGESAEKWNDHPKRTHIEVVAKSKEMDI